MLRWKRLFCVEWSIWLEKSAWWCSPDLFLSCRCIHRVATTTMVGVLSVMQTSFPDVLFSKSLSRHADLSQTDTNTVHLVGYHLYWANVLNKTHFTYTIFLIFLLICNQRTGPIGSRNIGLMKCNNIHEVQVWSKQHCALWGGDRFCWVSSKYSMFVLWAAHFGSWIARMRRASLF